MRQTVLRRTHPYTGRGTGRPYRNRIVWLDPALYVALAVITRCCGRLVRHGDMRRSRRAKRWTRALCLARALKDSQRVVEAS